MICAVRDPSCYRQRSFIAGLLTCPSAVRAFLTIPAIFIRDRLMAFAFLAHGNYDSSRQLKITRVIDIFIDKERGSESFDTNPS
jgi:hypothetical protein